MMNTFDVNHGGKNFQILICKQAQTKAAAAFSKEMGYSLESATSKTAMGSNFVIFLSMYLYYAYVAHCKYVSAEEPELSEFEFLELIQDYSDEDSNLDKAFEKVANELTTSIQKQVEIAKGKAKKKKSPPIKPTMN
jgi:hypothetical protein